MKSVKIEMFVSVDGLTADEAEAFLADFRDMAQKYVDNTNGEIAFVAHIPPPPRPDPNAN